VPYDLLHPFGRVVCKKIYCWFNLKKEVTRLAKRFKFIEMGKKMS